MNTETLIDRVQEQKNKYTNFKMPQFYQMILGVQEQKNKYTNFKMPQFYQMILGHSSLRIPSVIACRIRSHPKVLDHHQLVLPIQSRI